MTCSWSTKPMRPTLIKAAGGTSCPLSGRWHSRLLRISLPPARMMRSVPIGAGLELALGVETGGKVPEKLGMRVGIATGVVLVGDLLRSHVADNPPVIGETANLAARLQELAKPNSVVICDTTHRLAGALFEYRDLGLQRAKGLAEPLQSWQVLGRSKVANRFHALRSSRLPCVGRDAEIELLFDRWAQREGRTWRRRGRFGRAGHRQIEARLRVGSESPRRRAERPALRLLPAAPEQHAAPHAGALAACRGFQTPMASPASRSMRSDPPLWIAVTESAPLLRCLQT